MSPSICENSNSSGDQNELSSCASPAVTIVSQAGFRVPILIPLDHCLIEQTLSTGSMSCMILEILQAGQQMGALSVDIARGNTR